MTSDAELLEQVEAASRDAFALAQAKADGGSDDLATRARELDHVLDELVPAIQQVHGEVASVIQHKWTDARADVLWVLSNGTVPTSLRLGSYLRERHQD
jgi:hypothetical protein